MQLEQILRGFISYGADLSVAVEFRSALLTPDAVIRKIQLASYRPFSARKTVFLHALSLVLVMVKSAPKLTPELSPKLLICPNCLTLALPPQPLANP
jgi:hypothetical protein